MTPVRRYRYLYFRQGIGHESHGASCTTELIGQRGRKAYRQLKGLLVFPPLLTKALGIQHKKKTETGAGFKLPYLKATLSGRCLPVYTLEGIMMTVVAWTC